MKAGRNGSSNAALQSGYTIGRDPRNGSFSYIIVPGRGEVGVISAGSFEAAKQAAGDQIRNARSHGKLEAPKR